MNEKECRIVIDLYKVYRKLDRGEINAWGMNGGTSRNYLTDINFLYIVLIHSCMFFCSCDPNKVFFILKKIISKIYKNT